MTKQFDIYRYLEQNRKIAVIWSTSDVLRLRGDLTEDQAWEVLQRVDEELSAELGITLQTLLDTAWDLFGDPPDS